MAEETKVKWGKFSATVPPELQSELQKTGKESGMTQAEFLKTMLAAYKSQLSEEGETQSQEVLQVRSRLAQIQTLVEAVLNRADDQTRQTQESIAELKATHSEEVAELGRQIESYEDLVGSLKSENLKLKEAEESREELKSAWLAKEAVWIKKEEDYEKKLAEKNEKLSTLSEENIAFRKEIESLRKESGRLNAEIAELKNSYQLQLKDLEIENQRNLSKITSELKQEHDSKIESMRKEHENAVLSLKNESRLEAEKRIAELKEQLSNERKETESRIEELKDQLSIERTESGKRITELQKQISVGQETVKDLIAKIGGENTIS